MATNQTVIFPIEGQSPAITNARAPFDSLADADVILCSSDEVDFRVFKMFIAFVSPVFKDILTLPQGTSVEDEMKDHIPIIQMTENGRAIENLCYLAITSKRTS